MKYVLRYPKADVFMQLFHKNLVESPHTNKHESLVVHYRVRNRSYLGKEIVLILVAIVTYN